MQFLVYLVLLTVSVSTVLLEVHWLTSPAPQPRPIAQASSPPVSKTEGSDAALRPVYQQKPDAPRSANVQTQITSAAAPQPAGQDGFRQRRSLLLHSSRGPSNQYSNPRRLRSRIRQLYHRPRPPDPPKQTRGRGRSLRRNSPVLLPWGRTTLGRPPPVHRGQ
jgi:hypothetical protein